MICQKGGIFALKVISLAADDSDSPIPACSANADLPGYSMNWRTALSRQPAKARISRKVSLRISEKCRSLRDGCFKEFVLGNFAAALARARTSRRQARRALSATVFAGKKHRRRGPTPFGFLADIR
jgi:hypothetical protein